MSACRTPPFSARGVATHGVQDAAGGSSSGRSVGRRRTPAAPWSACCSRREYRTGSESAPALCRLVMSSPNAMAPTGAEEWVGSGGESKLMPR